MARMNSDLPYLTIANVLVSPHHVDHTHSDSSEAGPRYPIECLMKVY
jgi:hypothetical protein